MLFFLNERGESCTDFVIVLAFFILLVIAAWDFVIAPRAGKEKILFKNGF